MATTLTPRGRLWLAAPAGLAVALGQVPFSAYPVAMAGLVALAWLIAGASGPRVAAWIGLVAGAAYFAVTLHWIVEPFLVDLARHGWMAPFALVLTAGGFALFWAAGAALSRALGGGALAFAGAMAAMEAARSLILTGFPWAMIGYVWSETGAAQIAAWTGPFGLTALTLLWAGAVAALLGRRRPVAAAAALAALILLPPLLGAARIAPDADTGGAPVVRIVQPNIPQRDKWRAETAWDHVDALIDATAAGPSPDLVVWPETTVPFLATPGHPDLAVIAEAAGGAPVLFGAVRQTPEGLTNALVHLGPGGEILEAYDKRHLVPFGEYVPLLGRLPGQMGGLAAGFVPGQGARSMDLGRLGRILPLICYEAIFPEEVGAAPRPDWMVQATNDAWFGTFAGPQQHLAQARMRTIEQGLPLVRAANTGISAVIDARGRVVAALGLGEAGTIDAALPGTRILTPYARWGDWPAWGAIALMLLVAAIGSRQAKHR